MASRVIVRGHVNSTAAAASAATTGASGAIAALVTEAVGGDVAELASQVAAMFEIIGESGQTIGMLDLELPVGRKGGSILVEPDGGFAASNVGAPVFVTVAPGVGARKDEAQGIVIAFSGEVINRRQMRLHWCATGPAPARVRVNYLVGSL